MLPSLEPKEKEQSQAMLDVEVAVVWADQVAAGRMESALVHQNGCSSCFRVEEFC